LKYAWKKTCPQFDAHLEIRLLSAQTLLNRIHARSDANQHQTDANQQTKKRKMCERDVVRVCHGIATVWIRWSFYNAAYTSQGYKFLNTLERYIKKDF